MPAMLKCFRRSVDLSHRLGAVGPSKNWLGLWDFKGDLFQCYSRATNSELARVACLNDTRGVVQISGPDAVHFLNVRGCSTSRVLMVVEDCSLRR